MPSYQLYLVFPAACYDVHQGHNSDEHHIQRQSEPYACVMKMKET